MTRNPIYKDTIYSATGESLTYRIEDASGETLVRGVASVKPDGSPIKIYINRQVEPFLSNRLEPATGLTRQEEACETFYLYNDLNDVLLETYVFIRSYSGEWQGADKLLSDPIRPNVSRNMLLPISVYSASEKSMDIDPSGETRCSHYLRLDRYSYSVPAQVDETHRYYFYITDTDIPYKTYEYGNLFAETKSVFSYTPQGDYTPPGEGAVKTYYNALGNINAVHSTTGTNDGFYFLLNSNMTGQPRQFTERIYYKCPAGDLLLATINIYQSA